MIYYILELFKGLMLLTLGITMLVMAHKMRKESKNSK